MTLLKYIKVNRSAPLFMLAWQGGFFLVGVAMVLFINAFLNEEPDYACMGTLFILLATLVSVFARGNMWGSTRFSLAVSMGQTRRSYLLCDSLVTVLTAVLGVVVAWCIYQLESRLYAALYPGFTNDMPLDGIFRLKYMLPAFVTLVLLELIFSAITLRYGTRVFRIVWLAVCFSFMLIPRMIEAHQSGSLSLFGRIGGVIMVVVQALSVKVWIGIGAAVLLAILCFAVSIFRRAEVKL